MSAAGIGSGRAALHGTGRRKIAVLSDPNCPMEFGQRIGAPGTPTWFLESGARFTGAASLKQLTLLLDEAPAVAREAGRRS